MYLIVAEKPSLARNIAAAIGGSVRRNGYLECPGYLVTWAFGHLFSLVDIEDYQGGLPASGKARWTLENLPCIPDEFRFELRRGDDRKVDPGIRGQFDNIVSLANRPDVEAIVNAGDADREGEIIVRTCIRFALKNPKPMMRLWLPDQTPETVRAALASLESDDKYDDLANEGYARTYIDWLYGTNLTRYATLKTGKFLRVGRVIVPIVRAVYDRDVEIRNFVPKKYFAIRSAAKTGGEVVELISKNRYDADKTDEARAYCDRLNAEEAVVTDKSSKTDRMFPGKLFSLSTLQNLLGKKYKMSMNDSLATVQKLYEEGYLTYPRTNSEYLSKNECDKVRQILSGISKLGYPVAFRQSKSIFDDSKIESHSAITPTYKIPEKGKLSERENQVYATVFRRFVANFCSEECKVEKSEITVRVGDVETFTLKGTVLVEPGWTKYDDYTRRDKILPNLSVGDRVNIRFAPEEKETTPPKHYTIETLNQFLKNPFREEREKAAEDGAPEDDAEEYRAIFLGLELGTEATRTGIIENAKRSRYIALKKDVYTILPDGEYLVQALDRMKIDMNKYKTAEMGKALKAVYRREMTVSESVSLAAKEISEIFAQKDAIPGQNPGDSGQTGKLGEIVGDCPLCGEHVVRGRFRYGCMGFKNGCKFTIPVNLCRRDIPIAAARDLLTSGKTKKIDGFVSRAGRTFGSELVLRDGNVEFAFSTQKKDEKKKPAAKRKAAAKKK
ncbi:MAG: topoisomerase C-terminal repeat-containing protein [Clostridia bacterium]|nr:topoisomerase C-terminal repeat-containing protein [Clostridia bacterium]